jgi:hypothetical protein
MPPSSEGDWTKNAVRWLILAILLALLLLLARHVQGDAPELMPAESIG